MLSKGLKLVKQRVKSTGNKKRSKSWANPEELAVGRGKTMSFENVEYENVEDAVKFLDEPLSTTTEDAYRLICRR